MKFWFMFFMTLIVGIDDEAVRKIYVEDIPVIQNRHFSEFDESNESSSNMKKRKWGNPDPYAEVVALSPAELQDSRMLSCKFCDSKFPREQNLQYHYMIHNVRYELPKKDITAVTKKKVYVCPELNCIHHDPTRALCDIGTIKKHYHRKHTEKSLTCDKCPRKYALKSDLKAHQKTCGTKNYECNICGSKYSRIDSFEVHKIECQLEGSMSNEITQISTGKVSEVKDVPNTESSIPIEPSNPSSINYIAQDFERWKVFETSEFGELEQLLSGIEMSDSSQQHALHAYSYQENSLWDFTYWDMV